MLNIYVIYICIQYTHIEDMSYLVKTRGNKMGFPTIARSMHLGHQANCKPWDMSNLQRPHAVSHGYRSFLSL